MDHPSTKFSPADHIPHSVDIERPGWRVAQFSAITERGP
jgi:hypothetical protein